MSSAPVDNSAHRAIADAARDAARKLQALPAQARVDILNLLASKLVSEEAAILAANAEDISVAAQTKLDANLLSRLKLTPAKLATLAQGIRQIAQQADPLGAVLRRTEVSEGLALTQIRVPLGVLLVIFESRPDALPQIAALSAFSANGLILKGGKEAAQSNRVLHALVAAAITEATAGAVDGALVSLVTSRDDIASLLTLDGSIDLIIPRGSSQLVRSIQQGTRIPVMGHSEGVCHVYVDAAADTAKAVSVVVDAKTDYPAACNAAETLLLHAGAVANGTAAAVLTALKAAGVTLYGGPAAVADATVSPYLAGAAPDLHHEYGDLTMSVEIVADLAAAVQHCHAYGSGHTEAIVTEDAAAARAFTASIDAACVFVNASTRFADGFRFGLGAEVGISTSRLHARGPVGVEGLTSTKWVLRSELPGAGACHTVGAFASGEYKYTHKSLPL